MGNSSNFGNSYNSTDWIKTLNILKQNILASTVVIRLAKIVSKSSGTILCQDINDSNLKITCSAKLQYITDESLVENTIVCIACTDIDYRQNLQRIKNNIKCQNVENKLYHSINFGIILGLLEVL